DGAIRFCSLALEAMQARDLEAQNTNLLKAQRILGELMSSLDRKVGGDMAGNLFQIYSHMLEQLVNANLYDQNEPVERVLEMLRDLRATWQELDRLASQAQSPEPSAQAILSQEGASPPPDVVPIRPARAQKTQATLPTPEPIVPPAP